MVNRSLRVGVTAIAIALMFRLTAGGDKLKSFLVYLETGHHVRFSASDGDYFPGFSQSAEPVFLMLPTEPPETQPPETIPPETLPSYFCAPEIVNTSGKTPDTDELLDRPLRWNLYGDKTVLILHTHATESYTKHGENYKESASWRTLDENYNMISIGARVAELLEEAGIGVIHDKTLHDYPSYNGSYAASRETMAAILAENPGIQLVLDLHRDAADMGWGQLRTLAQAAGKTCAQLMVVIGGGQKGYEDNLSLGLKLTAQLERQAPGITRNLLMRSATFNQDLCPGALLIEVGAAGNSREEALLAAEQLAEAIIALAEGTA